MLGRRNDVRLRSVRDDDSPSRGGLHVDVVDPHAGPCDHTQAARELDQLGGHLRGRADHDALVDADPLPQLLLAPVEAQVDVEVVAQQLHPGVPDLLLDEDPGPPVLAHGIRSTTHSMDSVRACTSAGSTAGNIPIRSWLRPSLR